MAIIEPEESSEEFLKFGCDSASEWFPYPNKAVRSLILFTRFTVQLSEIKIFKKPAEGCTILG
jgi:hypothetical protein